MGNYKLIALDLDGTLLTEEKTISEENRAALLEAQDAGISVIFSTGRGVQNVQQYIEELQLTSPIVTVNGGEVWKQPGELHVRHTLDAALVRRMHTLAKQYDTWFWGYSVNELYNKERWLPDEETDARQWLKFGYYTENAESLGAIREELNSWGLLELTNSHPCNIEVNPRGVTKASGVRAVCTMLGIEMSQVVAMGDSLNDESMIREAGLGIAMGNAQEAVKRFADTVTLTNEEHGVAHAIRKYALV
ncbi:Cof-type HAD-IIB family hydrolase [Paenibacillus allorhizosphaerae]|uniref:5-amino-6-(5-phospho-D-ribitylamino)uracil phosphatase YcsE n=1 Tax=Paenibacillus allorhizosphaerae TaxID=2849866 RepID=A0ABN7TQV0_9BACL|nr:Cof-type HAD-IIB family hydrolase [Paenibacillus allorhizosphaerae]CAG7647216.1 5-amino-6-(5-phospho-D-ribitylamino)uracil phosphatase YcsE [Paenibacillus allorhizosphaerae]